MWSLIKKRRAKAVTHFQTRHAESAIKIDEGGSLPLRSIMNVAHDLDRNVVMLFTHQNHWEMLPGDAFAMLCDLSRQILAAADSLVEKNHDVQ